MLLGASERSRGPLGGSVRAWASWGPPLRWPVGESLWGPLGTSGRPLGGLLGLVGCLLGRLGGFLFDSED
eukprot:422539-Pyramimonas_sp.AAC.1